MKEELIHNLPTLIKDKLTLHNRKDREHQEEKVAIVSVMQ